MARKTKIPDTYIGFQHQLKHISFTMTKTALKQLNAILLIKPVKLANNLSRNLKKQSILKMDVTLPLSAAHTGKLSCLHSMISELPLCSLSMTGMA